MLKYLLQHNMIDGSGMTVTGKTLAENLAVCPDLKAGQDVILPFDKPIKPDGHLQILYGNLAPEGSVGKITGKEGLEFEGKALCFDSEEDMLEALSNDTEQFRVRNSSCILIYNASDLISLLYACFRYPFQAFQTNIYTLTTDCQYV